MTRQLLPRWLSKKGVASRRQAEELVHAGRVTVNGRVVRDVLSTVHESNDRVAVDGEPVGRETLEVVWYAINKARGVLVTTQDPEGRPTVMDVLPKERPPGVAPVGRLDKDSGGLLLFTNDHEAAAKLMDPASKAKKTYAVKVRGVPDEAALQRLRTERMQLDGLEMGPMTLVEIDRVTEKSAWLTVILEEGKNRQIRRQLDEVGHPVEVLFRTRIGPIAVGGLRWPDVRVLTEEEVRRLTE